MQSVILSYIWQDGVERLTIGWTPLVDRKKSECKQVIKELCLDHSRERREEVKRLSASDLMTLLNWLMEDNEIAVIRPN